jgi:hypothetical protein
VCCVGRQPQWHPSVWRQPLTREHPLWGRAEGDGHLQPRPSQPVRVSVHSQVMTHRTAPPPPHPWSLIPSGPTPVGPRATRHPPRRVPAPLSCDGCSPCRAPWARYLLSLCRFIVPNQSVENVLTVRGRSWARQVGGRSTCGMCVYVCGCVEGGMCVCVCVCVYVCMCVCV